MIAYVRNLTVIFYSKNKFVDEYFLKEYSEMKAILDFSHEPVVLGKNASFEVEHKYGDNISFMFNGNKNKHGDFVHKLDLYDLSYVAFCGLRDAIIDLLYYAMENDLKVYKINIALEFEKYMKYHDVKSKLVNNEFSSNFSSYTWNEKGDRFKNKFKGSFVLGNSSSENDYVRIENIDNSENVRFNLYIKHHKVKSLFEFIESFRKKKFELFALRLLVGYIFIEDSFGLWMPFRKLLGKEVPIKLQSVRRRE